MADASKRQAKKKQFLDRILHKEQEKAKIKQIRKVLKKKPWERLPEEVLLLQQYSDVVEDMQSRINKRLCTIERLKEVEDSAETLAEKCWQLAQAIKEAHSMVVYTGAGISTAAEIPDYRGPEGIWTLLQKGKPINVQDLSSADPTFTHMSLARLYQEGYLSHLVSQNCDGLHLRSGLPCRALSEVHGNMYIEVCPKCKPLRQYIRLFDVTEHTGLHRHKTGRKCHRCAEPLQDTIVHFGERGKLRWPLNWEGAVAAVNKCDMILCLGTSLKVLRRYPCLWKKDRSPKLRPKLYIVNLQWTPKDDQAILKINGKCDDVLRLVMDHLGLTVPPYNRSEDPMFHLATLLRSGEENTTTRKQLVYECPYAQKNSLQKIERLSKIESILRTRRVLYRDHSYAKGNRDYVNMKKIQKNEQKSEIGLYYNFLLPSSSSFQDVPESIEAEKLLSTNYCDSFSPEMCLESNNLISLKTENSSLMNNAEENKEVKDTNNIGITGWYGKGRRKCHRTRRKRL